EVGGGGMGRVYGGEDHVRGRQVALKVLNLADSDGQFAERLMREARIIAQLEHPGIVPVHDSGTLPDGRVFYTMKLVQGKRLDEHVYEQTALPERLRLFQKICEPVAFAHARGVLHRDLKPETVMIGPFGEVLVMDWGVSKILPPPAERSTLSPNAQAATADPENTVEAEVFSGAETIGFNTAHGAVIGTPGYMAPEQARGDTAMVSERSEIYSLGAILRFLVFTEPVEGDPGPRASNNSIGIRNRRILSAILTKAMSPQPSERYCSVRELAADVEHYLDGVPVAAYPEGWLNQSWRWIMRNRVWILLVLAYLFM